MSTNLVPYSDVERMAVAVAKSGLFGLKTPDQALALMMVAQAEGLHPASAASEFDIIQGKPARKTHSVLARFQAAGGTVQWKELTDSRAVGVFSHKQGGTVEIEWTFDRAKKIGLTAKDNWKNYPRAMLRARCIAEGVRAVYPGAIGGLLVVEEAQDLPPPEKDMGQVERPNPWTDEIKAQAKEAADAGMKAYAEWWKEQPAEFRNAAVTTQEHAEYKALAAAPKEQAIDVESKEVPQEGGE